LDKINASKGDVFLIPLDESRVGLGQVVDVLPSELYLVAFAGSWPAYSPPIANDVIGREPRFATLSFDAKLWNGDWRIIGNTVENLPSIRLPLFKVRCTGCVLVEKHDGSKSRLASTDEAQFLRYRSTVAPVRLENAVKADHGIADWNPAFDKLFYSYAKDSSELEI
jgi:hypothetical protein